MDTQSLLASFSNRGIKVWYEGENIKIQSKVGLITDVEKTFIRNNKAEILSCLKDAPAAGDHSVSDFLPYGLTPLQQAYWVGESGLYGYSSPAFFYEEYTTKSIDVDQLALAANKLVERHEMLRTQINSDAKQQTCRLEDFPPLEVTQVNLRRCTKRQRSKRLFAYREIMQREVADINTGPHFAIHVHRWKGGQMVHFLGRFMVGDGWSWTLFLKELACLYETPDYHFEPLTYHFRDYINHLSERQTSSRYQRSLAYWQERIPQLPPSPQLPTRDRGEEGEADSGLKQGWQTMTRRSFYLDESQWESFVRMARHLKLTPSNLLCSAYCEVLALWSRSTHFTLNLMYTRRENLHPQIDQVFGNFSATMLLEVDLRQRDSLQNNARRIQHQLFADLEHTDVAGVDVVRILNQQQGGGLELPSVPVVFASMVNDRDNTEQLALDKLGWQKEYDSIITPQVLIDLQVEDHGKGIRVNMDTQDGHYQPGLLDQLHEANQRLVMQMVDDSEVWGRTAHESLEWDFVDQRQEINATEQSFAGGCLHDIYYPQLLTQGNPIAIVTPTETYTYQTLHNKAMQLAHQLPLADDSLDNPVIAVVADKSFAQVASILAALQTGASYLPISLSMPAERIKYVLESCRVETILWQQDVDVEGLDTSPYRVLVVDDSTVPAEETFGALPAVDSDHLAYIIFTSGSTGKPKGVMLKHRAAMNTLHDINERFEVTAEDRILAFSPINFDLSVYDLFGCLAAGATMVIPDSTLLQDARYLVQLIQQEAVTVLNCVPAVVEMIVEEAERKEIQLSSVSLVMMSGDWIPIGLPERIRRVCNAKIYSLGGATEAAIWSCYYPIETVDPSWKSIPYGYPLANQQLFVLNERLEPCPNGVAGEIHIGGVGLAEGYWQDADKTNSAFIHHPETGERLYKTGDWGLYHTDGKIEFLGRQDSQVKIRGYRIELGEIEAVVGKLAGVELAVADVRRGAQHQASLVVFVKPTGEIPLDPETLGQQLAAQVPSYMVPSSWVILEQFPLTTNSKVDRKALANYSIELDLSEHHPVSPRNDMERQLAKLWREVLTLEEQQDICVNRSFFELGGNSLLAVRMLSLVERQLGVHIPIHDIVEANSIAHIAQIATQETVSREVKHLVRLNNSNQDLTLVLIHPIGGNLFCYGDLVKRVGSYASIVGLQSSANQAQSLTIEAIAQIYVDELRQGNPQQRYVLMGWSFGGVIGYEMSIRLRELGHEVELVMVDPWVPKPQDSDSVSATNAHNECLAGFVSDLLEGAGLPSYFDAAEGQTLTETGALASLQERDDKFNALSLVEFKQFFALYRTNRRALTDYRLTDGSQRLTIIAAERPSPQLETYLRPVATLLTDRTLPGSRVVTLTGHDHYSIINAAEIGDMVIEKLTERAAFPSADITCPA